MSIERELSPKAVISLIPEETCRSSHSRVANVVVATEGGEGDSDNDSSPAATACVTELRVRVEQQSTLISMLKQRNDETFKELELCRRNYKEALSQHQDLDHSLREETKARSLLEQRFQCLASNHEEMIKIKDEYKSQNQTLLQENQKLRNGSRENLLQEQEIQLQSLRQTVREERERLKEMQGKCVSLKERVGEMEIERAAREKEHGKEVEKHKQMQEVSHRKCVTMETQLVDKEKELKLVEEKMQKSLTDKELALKAKKAEISGLHSDLDQLRKEKTKLKKELEDLSQGLSRDSLIQKLKNELEQAHERAEKLQREYSAFKKHSSLLLQQEKELNSRLRHVSDMSHLF